MTVVTNLDDAATMLRKRGLEPNGRVQQIFTNLCAKEMDGYTPMRQGILKNTRIIAPDSVTYITPYARNMYYGVVMVDPITGKAGILIMDKTTQEQRWISRKGVRKIPSDREYSYHGAPKRGKLWDVRMWADYKKKIVANVAKAAGGTPN